MLALLRFKHENGILQEQICKTNNKTKSKQRPGLYSATVNWWDSVDVRDWSSTLGPLGSRPGGWWET